MTPIEKDRIIERVLAWVKEEMMALGGFPADVERVLRCLHDHLFDESFDVNVIIESSGVRKTEIYGRFKVCVGMSIRRYREIFRMKAARRLLCYDELGIFLIAYRLGYTSGTSFGRAFRRYVGCSPTAYRGKMMKENVERSLIA